MANGKKLFYSRLARKEEKSNIKKAFFFSVLTIGLLVALFLLGIPFLVKAATFMADLKKSGNPVEQTDTLPPQPPQFNSLSEYSKDQTISISGFAEASSTVEIFLNGSPVGTVITGGDGVFNFSKINLSTDKNELYATATDQTNNKSQPSQKSIIVFDNTPPTLDISSPQDGSSITGERKRKIKITGQTKEASRVMINDRLVIIGAGGNFSSDFNLADGDNQIKVIATDQADNQTEKDIKVTFSP
ncbi:MAG: Ig-like domain-containing protein [bacterium]|nr:Ig-like domain-containing protein [bacterium]